jgi:F-type H+-transporting ATPase subunit delta
MSAEYDQVGQAYAAALVELAQSDNILDQVHADIDGLQSVFKENAQIKEFLQNPVADMEKKKKVVGNLAKEASLQKQTVNFLNLLMDKDRIGAIDQVFEAFEQTYCKLTETQVATVRSAVKLEQEQQFLIAKKLQELTGSKNIKLKPVIDESLIAGFIVEYGSSQIDLSVKGQLDKISVELQGGQVAAATA